MKSLVNLPFGNMIWREFRFLTVAGGVYGIFHTKMWAAATTANYIVMYSVVYSMMSLLAYTTYLLHDHLSYMSQAIHLLICGLVAATASLTLTFNRSKVEGFEILFDQPWSLSEYGRNEYFEGLIKATTRRKNQLILTWILIYGTCGIIGMNQPVIDKMFGSTSHMDNLNGAWLNLPVIIWWPVDITESRNAWLVAFLYQSLYLVDIAVIVTSAVVLCFTTMERLLDQIKLLIYSIEKLDERANVMFRQRFPGSDEKRMEMEYEDCYYDCIIQNVKHHLEIITYVETNYDPPDTRIMCTKYLVWIERFMDMASIPVAVPFFGGAVLLGMALITISEEDDPRVGPKVLAAALAFSEGYNMYLLCHMGQQIQQLDLYEALYFCGWFNRSNRVKKAIHIMRLGCTRPLKFTAAKLIVLNMELFADLVNSAYSIFNLKAVSKDKDS